MYVCMQVSEAVSFSTAHAQVTMLRGKRKHLCDFSVEVGWQLELLGATPTTTLQGTLQVRLSCVGKIFFSSWRKRSPFFY